jgi:hypothetical protein
MLTLGVSVGEGSAPWVTPRRSVARVDDTEKTRAANATLPASYYGIRLRRDHDRQWPRDVQSFRSIHHRRRETAFMVVPSMNIGIIVLTTAAPVGVPEALTYLPPPKGKGIASLSMIQIFMSTDHCWPTSARCRRVPEAPPAAAASNNVTSRSRRSQDLQTAYAAAPERSPWIGSGRSMRRSPQETPNPNGRQRAAPCRISRTHPGGR